MESSSPSNLPISDDHEYRTLICGHCGHEIQIPVSCKNRFCTICGRTRSRRIRYKLSEFVKHRHPSNGYGFKLLTLSIENRNDLKTQVVLLTKSFRRLRQRRIWRDHVAGGATVIEVKRGSNGWHAHLHVLLEARYIAWHKLKLHWEAVSGGSAVHIKRIPPAAIIQYVTKYVTKSDMPIGDQRAASAALRNVRLFQPFGQWHAAMLAVTAPHAVCGVCERAVWLYIGCQSAYKVLDRRRNWKPLDNAEPVARPPTRHAVQTNLFSTTHRPPA